MAGGIRTEKRPHFRAAIGELENLYRQHPYNKKILMQLDKELACRKVKSSRQLHALVRERLDEIKQKESGKPLLRPVPKKTPSQRMEQASLLNPTKPTEKQKPQMELPIQKGEEQKKINPPVEEMPPRAQPAEDNRPTETSHRQERSASHFLTAVAVLICLACLVLVTLTTLGKDPIGKIRERFFSSEGYEEQVRNLLN